MKKKYYAYFVPRNGNKGITYNWSECERIIAGESNARFRSFKTREEAQEWLDVGADYGFRKRMPPGVYFDAGTGRGSGVEISVTDENGNNLLGDILPRTNVNRFGKHWVFKEVTNNYGELLACKYALQIALKRGIKKIFGDSKLIINYWSKGFIRKGEIPKETFTLAKSAVKLRKEFELLGGDIEYVSGEDNPADLGFHK